VSGVCLVLALAAGGFATTAEAARPRRPPAPALAGAAIGPSTVSLSWSASSAAVVGYNLYRDGLPAHHVLWDSGTRSATVHNLDASSTHAFTVRAYTAAGSFSLDSNAVVLTTPAGSDAVAPSAPSNLRTYSTTTASRVSLMWDHATDDVGVTAYEVHMDGVPVAELVPSVFYSGPPDWYTTIRHLAPGSTHGFSVTARDESGNVSPPSDEVVVTTPDSDDVTPPAAPEIYFASAAANCGFVDLSWNAGGDDVDAWHQLDFEIYEDGELLTVWRGEVIEGAFGRHRWHVRSVDRAGNASPPSNEVVLDSGPGC
jgi:hypothetical protein